MRNETAAAHRVGWQEVTTSVLEQLRRDTVTSSLRLIEEEDGSENQNKSDSGNKQCKSRGVEQSEGPKAPKTASSQSIERKRRFKF